MARESKRAECVERWVESVVRFWEIMAACDWRDVLSCT